jgi:hypothetical protein
MPTIQTIQIADVYAETAPANDDVARRPLRAAVLSDAPQRLTAALGRNGITAIDAGTGDIALLLAGAPDLLVIDIADGSISPRRIALLASQLGWARHDLVVAVSNRSTGAAYGFSFDMVFDSRANDRALDLVFSEARHILTHSRLRHSAAETPAPALLRRASARRHSLFR